MRFGRRSASGGEASPRRSVAGWGMEAARECSGGCKHISATGWTGIRTQISIVFANVDDTKRSMATESAEPSAGDELDLLDWRRSVFDLYAEIRAAPDTHAVWRLWREERDRLFRTHPQSPIPATGRRSFRGVATSSTSRPAVLPHTSRRSCPSSARSSPARASPMHSPASARRPSNSTERKVRSRSTGSRATAAESSSPSATTPAARRPTPPAVTCSTQSRVPTCSVNGALVFDFYFAYKPVLCVRPPLDLSTRTEQELAAGPRTSGRAGSVAPRSTRALAAPSMNERRPDSERMWRLDGRPDWLRLRRVRRALAMHIGSRVDTWHS